MGKQVSFILLPRDLQRLEEELTRIGPFVVLHSRSQSKQVCRLEGLGAAQWGGENWLYVFLVRPDDIDFVVTQSVPAQGYWSIDVLRSPVIEFHGCFCGDGKLRRGRAYFVEQYYGEGMQLVQKPEAFRVWARSVLLTIRRKLDRHGTDYIGADAKRWLSSGAGVLVN